MSDTIKQRVRVQAGSSAFTGDAPMPRTQFVGDSFQNLSANMGYGTNNVSSGASYGFNPITRNRNMLDWMYRGSWLVRKVIDCPADDMTREGLNIESDMPPDKIDEFTQYWNNLQLWQRINSTLKWARLYGGCIAVIMIEGQDFETPLRLDTVGRGQFKGLLVLDRWMVWPHMEQVKDYGADFGQPVKYEVVADARSVPRLTVHHSRTIRFDGTELPYWQKQAENGWGLSVVEPLWDRMIAFDSATQGAAQLIYKAHLRVMKIKDYRNLIAAGGALFQAVMKQLNMIRVMQTNEGMTVLDAEDEFESQSYSFAGLSDMMIQFGQQVSGAADIPMTRMFGQSPAGMNSTGESDLRNYYDGCRSQQEFRLRRPIKLLLDISHRSLYGVPLPRGFNYSFKPLWQLTDEVKAQIVTSHAGAVSQLVQGQVFTPAIALKEIRQSSRITGFGSNITDEDIKAAEEMPPPMPDPNMMGGMGGDPNDPNAQGQQGQLGAAPGGAPSEEDAKALLPDGHPDKRPTPTSLSPREAIARLAAVGGKRVEEDEAAARAAQATGGSGAPTGSPTSPVHGAHVNLHEGVRARINLPHTRVNLDRRSIVDMGGLQCIIETAKGESRVGYGWSSVMPCHYGYISGTASAEGGQEQMDCFIGENLESDKAWVIDQVNPSMKTFDEHKVMLGFDSKDQALQNYYDAFADGSGRDRVGTVRQMSIPTLRDWLENNWQYNSRNDVGVVR